jgi:type I restriction enzyme M protein
MFYNTGISTYIWILDNNKPTKRKHKVQLINAVDMFGKMRKSLGSKRKELRSKDIERICHLYEGYRNEHGTDDHPAHSKVFKDEEFGYSTITVERPLQLRFTPTEDKVEEVLAQKSIEELKPGEQAAIRKAVAGLIGWEWKDRGEFIAELTDALRKAGLTKPPAPLIKTIWTTIGEHDDDATIVTDSKGNPEPDPSLRDTENVPLAEDIVEYFEREVLPHVPDAWIDHDKTKVGYEIPFTRHFYRYAPPRPLNEIQKDLRVLVGEIQEMLAEVGA